LADTQENADATWHVPRIRQQLEGSAKLPESVGGGDWKLLGVCGAAIGLIAPLAAALVLIVAAPAGYVQSWIRGRREDLPMGPGLAAGYVVAVVVAVLWPSLFGQVE